MTKRTSHKPQKNWRRIVGMLAVFAVILGGLTMAQPRQARAVCETPASAIATLGLWLADSLGLLGDFGGALQDYLIADVETGQDEIEKRIDDFDYHTRQGWGEWWQGNNGALQNMRDQSKQLSTATMDETRMRGSMMDADASAEREADIQKVANDVNNDNDIALNACTADSVLGGGGDGSGGGSSRPGSCSFNGMNVANGWRGSFSDACSNAPRTRGFRECCDGTVYTHYTSICGQDQPDVQANCSTGSTSGESGNAGMVFSVEASNDVTRALAKDASTRAVAAKDTPESFGIPAVIKDKWEKSMVYCDPDANGGTMPCPAGTDPELINKDIEVGSALLWGDSMTIDINDEKFATMMQDAERAFVDQTPAAAIPENMLNQPPAIKQFNMTRSTAARKQAVHAVIGGLMGTRVARPDIEPMTEVQDIRKSAGVPDANTTDKPSVHEITQALFQERYTKPEFVTQIVQDPEQLVKENLDIQSGYLMQWNMMYKNMEKLAVMYASEFAQDLEDSEPDFVANRGTDPFDGSRFTVDSDNDGEIEECEIVEFEIPENPWGCGSGYSGGVSDGAYAGQFSGSLMVPVDSNYVTSNYGPRNCSQCASNFHKGIDFRAAIGDPVYASADGMVVIANNDPSSSFGKYVKIDHGSGIQTLYAHLSQLLVGPNEIVTRGQLIGYAGNTSGTANLAPHLHFVVYNNGQKVDPNLYLDRNSVPAPAQGGGSGGSDGFTGDCSFDLSAIGDLDICGWPTGPSTGTVSPNLTAFLQGYEKLSLTPYYDFKGQSICYGHLITGNENPPIPIPATQAFCDQLYQQDLNRFASYVRNATNHCPNLTQNQFDALFSFAYNLGSFRGSVGTAVNSCDINGALAAAQQYNQAGGEVLQGLVDRRAQEQVIGNLDRVRPIDCRGDIGEDDADDHDDHDH